LIENILPFSRRVVGATGVDLAPAAALEKDQQLERVRAVFMIHVGCTRLLV
jgi:hypothetical protein